MGCCASRPSSPYNGNSNPSISSRAINPPLNRTSQPTLARPSTNHTTSSQIQTPPSTSHHVLSLTTSSSVVGARGVRGGETEGGAARMALNERFNQPLKPHTWKSKKRTWTRRQLDVEREAFFDTRVTGRPECWQTLNAALQVLWAAGVGSGGTGHRGGTGIGTAVVVDEEDRNTALATAQLMLEAAGMTLPTGDLVAGIYDVNGDVYHLPEHIVSDPSNLIVENEDSGAGGEDDKDGEGNGSSGMKDEEETARRREEKGKGVLAPEDMIAVKARLSDRGGPAADVIVNIGKGDSVRSLARRVFEEADLRPSQRIRIVYMGKMLKENESLLSQNWKEDHIINALVFDF